MDEPVSGARACDLCRHRSFRTTIELRRARALRSDRTVVAARLKKLSCCRCGLVCDRTAETPPGDFYYRDEYRIALEDHVFYTADGPRLRSPILADWILSSLDASGVPRAGIRRVLEVGAGAGFLVTELAGRLPHARCDGFELNQSAAEAAHRRGVPVTSGDLSTVPRASFDLVYAVAVLEHVPSPASFIADLKRVLRPGGHLVLVQPTQDVQSYDLFFIDHLHHFGTVHLAAYAGKCGFAQRLVRVGYECMPNFSLHVWSATDAAPAWQWPGPPAATACEATTRQVVADMQRLDSTLRQLTREQRRFGVFGLHEVFALARAYSSLESSAIQCGLDDDPGKLEYGQYGFPVMIPERCVDLGISDVLLTMNKLYYVQASERLTRLGLMPHPVLS